MVSNRRSTYSTTDGTCLRNCRNSRNVSCLLHGLTGASRLHVLIHGSLALNAGLMDENKQLRGSLKTMANFVSTGLGGFSNAIQLPEYDNALELVNRGDRALLLKLVQEKGGSVGGGMSTSTSSSNHHVQQHAHHSSSTKQSAAKASPSPPATAGTSSHSGTTSGTPLHTSAACDKKRKHEEAQTGTKAPRTRSQNNRGRQETATTATAGSSGEWPEQQQQQKQQQVQSQTGSVEPSPVPPSAPSASGTFGDPSRFVNTPEVQNQYLPRPASGMSMPQVLASTQMQNQNRDSRPNPDMFPSFLGQNNSLFSMDVFGATTPVGQSSGASNASSSFRGPGTISGAVKQEESPPLAPFQDSAQAWMNAYTNLTPVGGNDSFWSLASSAMNDQSASNQANQQQQMQRPQQGYSQSVAQASDPQDGRSPSSAFLSNWTTTASATNNMGAFAMSQQSTQQPLHGYA